MTKSDPRSTVQTGSSATRSALERFVAGNGRYIADVASAEALLVSFVRSELAHARLLALDVEAARRIPGIVEILVATDLVATLPLPKIWGIPGTNASDLALLATDRVLYAGHPYAVIVGENADAIAEAKRHIQAELEPLPHVLTIDEALSPDSVRLNEDWPDNRVGSNQWRVGDVEAGFEQAALTVSDRFVTQRVHPCSLEGRGVIAAPDGEGITVWTSTQSHFQVRNAICECLDLPHNLVRIIVPDVGGAFGMKATPSVEEVLTALLAHRLRRPVKWIEARREAFVASTHGRDQRIELSAAFDPEGRILAVRGEVVLDKGADTSSASYATGWLAGAILTGPYVVPASDISALAVVTNKTPTGPYRGFGQPEANFAFERLLDIAAHRLGLDPADVRRRNLVPAEQMPFTIHSGIVLDSGRYAELLDATLKQFGYSEAMARAAAERTPGRARGIGIACYAETTNLGPSALNALLGIRDGGYDTSVVRMERSGHVSLFTGQLAMGQGIETSLAQICSDELHVPMDDIRVLSGDTNMPGYTAYGSGGSRGAGLGGASVALASRKLAERLRRWGAHLLGVRFEETSLLQGAVHVTADPVQRASLRSIAEAAYNSHSKPEGMEPGLEDKATYDPVTLGIAYGTAVVEVDVDLETGKVQVTRVTFGHDCGVQINPQIVDGQIRGGVAQAIGATLFEALRYDAQGRPLALSLHDYLLPLATDVPSIDLLHLTTPAAFSPTGVKGVGESGIIPIPAAIANAVQQAIGGGARLTSLPLTPEAVLDAIEPNSGVVPSSVPTGTPMTAHPRSSARSPFDFDEVFWRQDAVAGTEYPQLCADEQADVVIIGAGYSGLSAALHLADKRRVIVVEAEFPGFGASGRNAAGFVAAYTSRTPAQVNGLLGVERGDAFNRMIAQSPALMLDIVERFGISADVRRSGVMVGAHTAAARQGLLAVGEQWRAVGADIDVIDADESFRLTGSRKFHGGMIYRDAGTLNPLSYVRGLADAAAKSGASIFAHSPALKVVREGKGWKVITKDGSVKARSVLIATDGFPAIEQLWPALEKTYYRLPFAVMASQSMPDRISHFLPGGMAISDTDKVNHLWLMASRGRLVASLLPPRGAAWDPQRAAAPFDAKLRRIFGDGSQVEWEHFWLGNVAVTKAGIPCVFRLDDQVHAIGGYSGQGITAATAAGREYANFLIGDMDEAACALPFFDPSPLPGKRAIPFLFRNIAAPLSRRFDSAYT